jgi:cytidine deaminase
VGDDKIYQWNHADKLGSQGRDWRAGLDCTSTTHAGTTLRRAYNGTPCGACRQVLAEFGLDTLVLIADADGNLKQEARLDELLPGAFGPGDLGK